MLSKNFNLKIGATVAVEAPSGSPFPIVDPDLYRSIAWLSANGLDSIEIHIRSPRVVDPVKVKERCAQEGIYISSIGTGLAAGEGLIVTSRDQMLRRAAIDRFKEQLALGAYWGCPAVLGSMRGEKAPDESFSAFESRMLETSRELADYAESVDAYLVIEAIDRFETSYLKRAEEVLELIDKVGSSRLQVHLDTYHMNLEEQTWEQPILLCNRRLGHVHVADNTRRYPGWGLVNFEAVLGALQRIHYKETLTIECYPYPDGYTAVLKGADYLRGIMDQMNRT